MKIENLKVKGEWLGTGLLFKVWKHFSWFQVGHMYTTLAEGADGKPSSF